MVKSFFNPFWKDVGFLSTYGRAWGVSWLWAIGLTAYHAVVSIAVPVFLTEALFSHRAAGPWLRLRGRVIASACLGLVTLLGFATFGSPEFHMLDVRHPVALANRLREPQDPVSQFIAGQLSAKTLAVLDKTKAVTTPTPELRHQLVDELNRLLPRPELYSQERFASVAIPEDVRARLTPLPGGDQLVRLNRRLLESAFAQELAERPIHPYYPPRPLTLACVLAVAGLVVLAMRQQKQPSGAAATPHPWAHGLAVTLAFAGLGFALPGLVEDGLRLPAVIVAALWVAFAALVARILRRMDGLSDAVWRRGLWALGVLTPWSFFAILLGVIVQFQGAKSFSGMLVVALAFGIGIAVLAFRWRSRLRLVPGRIGEPNGRRLSSSSVAP
jgi:hypothetical protein